MASISPSRLAWIGSYTAAWVAMTADLSRPRLAATVDADIPAVVQVKGAHAFGGAVVEGVILDAAKAVEVTGFLPQSLFLGFFHGFLLVIACMIFH